MSVGHIDFYINGLHIRGLLSGGFKKIRPTKSAHVKNPWTSFQELLVLIVTPYKRAPCLNGKLKDKHSV